MNFPPWTKPALVYAGVFTAGLAAGFWWGMCHAIRTYEMIKTLLEILLEFKHEV